MAAYRRVYDSHHLQADCQNRDQLRNPTLGNRVWATFTLFNKLTTNNDGSVEDGTAINRQKSRELKCKKIKIPKQNSAYVASDVFHMTCHKPNP